MLNVDFVINQTNNSKRIDRSGIKIVSNTYCSNDDMRFNFQTIFTLLSYLQTFESFVFFFFVKRF